MRSIVRRIVFGVGLLITGVGLLLVAFSLNSDGAILSVQTDRAFWRRHGWYPTASVRYVICRPLRMFLVHEDGPNFHNVSDWNRPSAAEELRESAQQKAREKMLHSNTHVFLATQFEQPPAIRFESTDSWRIGPFGHRYHEREEDSGFYRVVAFAVWPIPLIGLAILAATGPLSVGAFRRRSRVRRGACVACGYDRRSLAADVACPECGTGGGSDVTTRL